MGKAVSFLKEFCYRYYCLTTLKAQRGAHGHTPSLCHLQVRPGRDAAAAPAPVVTQETGDQREDMSQSIETLKVPGDPCQQSAKYDPSLWQAGLSTEQGKSGNPFLIPEASLI